MPIIMGAGAAYVAKHARFICGGTGAVFERESKQNRLFMEHRMPILIRGADVIDVVMRTTYHNVGMLQSGRLR